MTVKKSIYICKAMTATDHLLNRILNEDCLLTMQRMPEGLVDLTVTSPPYNVDRKYATYDDYRPVEEYLSFMAEVAESLYRVTRRGGRLCLNVSFIGNSYFLRKSDGLQFYPLIYVDIFQKAGWTFRDFAIWIKTYKPEDPNSFCGDSTQWGRGCLLPVRL